MTLIMYLLLFIHFTLFLFRGGVTSYGDERIMIQLSSLNDLKINKQEPKIKEISTVALGPMTLKSPKVSRKILDAQ